MSSPGSASIKVRFREFKYKKGKDELLSPDYTIVTKDKRRNPL